MEAVKINIIIGLKQQTKHIKNVAGLPSVKCQRPTGSKCLAVNDLGISDLPLSECPNNGILSSVRHRHNQLNVALHRTLECI